MIRYLLYNIVLALLAPWVALYLFCSSRHRALLRRFRPAVPEFETRPLWIHACSVGELNVLKGLLPALRERFPEVPVLATTATLSGYQLAKSTIGDAAIALVPFDLAGAVRVFLTRARPQILVLVETEVWPNLVRETRRFGVPVVVVNGRISPRRFPAYCRYQRVMPPAFTHLSAVGAQDSIYAARFAALGVSAESIMVTGNMKCDSVETEVGCQIKKQVRAENGFSTQDTVIAFGSTRPGDEQMAAWCGSQLKDDYPRLRLVVAPRHLQRIEEALEPFGNEVVLRRSQVREGRTDWRARVFFLDTLGELIHFYAIAHVAVVGGSFYPGVEGHNPLESAALGVPTVFGSYMGNFPDAAELLLDAGGAIQLRSPEDLPDVLRRLLEDRNLHNQIGTRGRKAVLENRGALARNVDLIARHMQG